ncbi:MAG: hypothetical protein U0793_07345 [Gemmataceae bacterium]
MPIILIDVNIEGQAARLWGRMQRPEWREFTAGLDVVFRRFRDVGLDESTPDDVVWRFCQRNGFYLLTSNRNEEGEDSLEATLRREGTPDSVPVLTLPLPDRVYDNPDLVDRVVDKRLDYIMFPERTRGAGRLFLTTPAI